MLLFFFFFNDTATTEIYTLSLHDALPICSSPAFGSRNGVHHGFGNYWFRCSHRSESRWDAQVEPRSEEHTSELQSQSNLVCRLLLEKKKNTHRRTALYGRRTSGHNAQILA